MADLFKGKPMDVPVEMMQEEKRGKDIDLSELKAKNKLFSAADQEDDGMKKLSQ